MDSSVESFNKKLEDWFDVYLIFGAAYNVYHAPDGRSPVRRDENWNLSAIYKQNHKCNINVSTHIHLVLCYSPEVSNRLQMQIHLHIFFFWFLSIFRFRYRFWTITLSILIIMIYITDSDQVTIYNVYIDQVGGLARDVSVHSLAVSDHSLVRCRLGVPSTVSQDIVTIIYLFNNSREMQSKRW